MLKKLTNELPKIISHNFTK